MNKGEQLKTTMTQEEIIAGLENLRPYVPAYLVEQSIGIPRGTISAVVNGRKQMPKKWVTPLRDFFKKTEIKIHDLENISQDRKSRWSK